MRLIKSRLARIALTFRLDFSRSKSPSCGPIGYSNTAQHDETAIEPLTSQFRPDYHSSTANANRQFYILPLFF